MAAANINIVGVEASIKDVDKVIEKLTQGLQIEMNEWANDTVTMAKDLAPTDEGHLKGAINAKYGNGNPLTASVTVAVDYAAYLEFGTRKYAAAYVAGLPADWQAFALEFKGKSEGGSFSEFVQRIMAWVQRKGIGGNKTKSGAVSQSASSLAKMQESAYWIALNIIQNGIKPHPYLYPAVLKTKEVFLQRIKNLFK